jgi:4-amino-4-deoxy-L-arabinose transferase-like glycosyltransferase
MRVSSPAKLQTTGFWEAALLPFLTRRSLPATVCFVAIGVARIAATYPILSVTTDEYCHFACGLEFVANHVYRYTPEHPPLARAMAATLPYLAGARPAGEPDPIEEAEVVAVKTGNPNRVITLARIGILPFFVLACGVVYFWSRHYFGNAAAVIATAQFTLLPPVLAHAGLATTDMALTASLGAAFLSLVLWAESPTWRRTFLLGLAAALAALTKFTSLLYLPAAAVLASAAWLALERPGVQRILALAKERAPRFGAAVALGAVAVWAGFLFSFGYVTAWDVRLPAPEFFAGILTVFAHNTQGNSAYLLGQFSQTGWWYYFPVVLTVKTPIAFLLLTGFGGWVCWRNRTQRRYWLPVVFSMGILLPAMCGNINIGVRHILPVYIGFSIVAAAGVLRLAKWSSANQWTGPLAVFLILWMAVSGVISHPDYLAYFNELAPAEREKVLVDSDLDWGQDVGRLSRRLRELGATGISMGSLLHVPDEFMKWSGLPPIQPINPVARATGWTVVSPTLDKTTQYGLFHRFPNVRPWYASMQPRERVGALILYYVPVR